MALGYGSDSFYKNIGEQALQNVAELQTQRKQFNQQANAQHTSNILSGGLAGGLGAAALLSAGPVGIAAGAIGGGLLGSFL